MGVPFFRELLCGMNDHFHRFKGEKPETKMKSLETEFGVDNRAEKKVYDAHGV